MTCPLAMPLATANNECPTSAPPVSQIRCWSVNVPVAHHRGASRTYDADSDQRAIGAVEQILRRGQDDGTFRTFDPFIMGSLVQRSVDGLPFLLETQSDLDLGVYAEELVETFDIATRRTGHAHDQGMPAPQR
jgi:hypothetical protein